MARPRIKPNKVKIKKGYQLDPRITEKKNPSKSDIAQKNLFG